MKETGGPVFPTMRIGRMGNSYDETPGIQLRDYFAAAALQGMLAAVKAVNENKMAAWAYRQADAMLAERKLYNSEDKP